MTACDSCGDISCTLNPEADYSPTVVIFRKWRTGDHDVIALLPELPGNSRYDCMSYMHVGQHGAANPGIVIDRTTPATDKESSSLALEMQHLGYVLSVRKRITPKTRANREHYYLATLASYQTCARYGGQAA